MTLISAAALNLSENGAVWILGPVAEDDGARTTRLKGTTL